MDDDAERVQAARKAREEQLRRVPLQKSDPTKWPSHIREIGLEELGSLGVDTEGRLYWDGKPVVTESRVSLEGWTFFFLAITAIGTFGYFLLEIARSASWVN
jgi:hypothetical protein